MISLGTLHNLRLFELQTALQEIERVGKNKYVMVESYRNEQELFNLQCWALTAEAFFDTAEWIWLYRHFGYTGDYEFIYLRMSASHASRPPRRRSWRSRAQPLIVDEIVLPDALDVGQVLVQGLHTTICGAQINEIDGREGPGQVPAAPARPRGVRRSCVETGPGVTHVQAGRQRGAALAAEPGHPEPAAAPTTGAARSSMPAGSRPSTSMRSSRRTA